MIQKSSLDAYRNIVKSQRNKWEDAIWDVIRYKKNVTNKEINKFTGIEINNVTARVFKLREKGRIVKAGIRECKITGNHVLSWRAV